MFVGEGGMFTWERLHGTDEILEFETENNHVIPKLCYCFYPVSFYSFNNQGKYFNFPFGELGKGKNRFKNPIFKFIKVKLFLGQVFWLGSVLWV